MKTDKKITDAAKSLAKRRWAGTDAAERSDALAPARAGRAKLPKEKRVEIARKAAAARHSKKKIQIDKPLSG